MYSCRVRTILERQHGHLVAVGALNSLVERRHADLVPRVLLQVAYRVRRHGTSGHRFARVVASVAAAAATAAVALAILDVEAVDETLIAIRHLQHTKHTYIKLNCVQILNRIKYIYM